MATCRTCGAEIEWVELRSGKWNPVDLVKIPVLPGEYPKRERRVVVTDDGDVVSGRKVEVGTEGAVIGRESHFATCPNANRHRRSK